MSRGEMAFKMSKKKISMSNSYMSLLLVYVSFEYFYIDPIHTMDLLDLDMVDFQPCGFGFAAGAADNARIAVY
ncbi:hypothetical protein DERP_003891 [Dermatophagoides pteronyssinus]|uniref:Uncharacterized protein n=1 Tax=Dermatophagoides pteronyssinus TaxID=6956 RepID=A0ABQ8J7L8_DERPT|nr:hypothetical protein DERP_003891 [Dermatophagoides pteronyssinus]